MAGRPVHDEQGTRDRPYNLTVAFVASRIDEALRRLGQRPWRGRRPVIVPIIAVHVGKSSYLLSAETSDGEAQRQAFADMARDFDLPVRFPAEQQLAAWRVSLTHPMPLHMTPSADDALVAGTLHFDESRPGWVGRWQWRHGDVEYTWGIKGVSFDEAFRDILRGVLRVSSGHGAPD
jgi:hypothetical protein